MPTRRIAEKSAALEVVKRLHQAGELDDLLRSIAREIDSDLEDEEKVAAKSVTHAGTERRNDYYPNRVSERVAGLVVRVQYVQCVGTHVCYWETCFINVHFQL